MQPEYCPRCGEEYIYDFHSEINGDEDVLVADEDGYCPHCYPL